MSKIPETGATSIPDVSGQDNRKLEEAAKREDIDHRLEALVTRLNADTPPDPTAKNFGGTEIDNLRAFVRQATEEGRPTVTNTQLAELLAQAAEGKNIKPLDQKAEIRPDDARSKYEPETGSISEPNPRTAIPGTAVGNAVTALGYIDTQAANDPFELSSPNTPGRAARIRQVT